MEKMFIIKENRRRNENGEKKLFKLRKKVNEMYFEKGIKKNKIVQKKGMSKTFVIKWTQSPEQDFMEDRRGWPNGKRRKWDDRTVNIIKEIHNSLMDDPTKFYIGATAIVQEWRKEYPNVEIPPLRTIGRILAYLHLSAKCKRGRNKGAARYLCYPEHTIYNLLGGRVLEADFIVKYFTNRTKPLSFIGFSFKKEPRIRYYKRTEGQTSREFKRCCDYFLKRFEIPDYIKMDNGAAMIGSVSGKRNISVVMMYLLKHQIIPIFAVPRKPFSQASIEGNNSVFSRKFWNKIHFKSIDEIDEKLEWFNKASIRYLGYEPPREEKRVKKDFTPKVYFIRQVREDKETENGYINVLNEKIKISTSFINFFVLAEWNLNEERLYIHFEKEKKPEVIKEMEFKINKRSNKKYIKSGPLSFGI
ncbi:hypothetical protein DRP43_05775 [candidate division TA06 bacterium]|uniref:Integrase catalytic domain-containing protein n=1 Tax=candidate division TA06 bacterium TaxID=2250710 RepID=A0A660SCG3_UNCT6|nr:MAG: hypothetical protein DRP43_05775 [candidate division TA06 bacterium]